MDLDPCRSWATQSTSQKSLHTVEPVSIVSSIPELSLGSDQNKDFASTRRRSIYLFQVGNIMEESLWSLKWWRDELPLVAYPLPPPFIETQSPEENFQPPNRY